VDAVTEVLIDRSYQADRLSRMVVVSFVAHAAFISLVALAPRLWPEPDAVDERHIMTISLAGAEGPVQGRNPESAKPVQQVTAEPVKAKDEAPPALAKPDMVEPIKAAKPEPKTVAKPEPKKEVPQLHGRTPTQGAEVRAGTARVQTGQTAAIPFGGLATGGGGTPGAYTDFADFCCPEYIQVMKQQIYANWRVRQGQDGVNKMKFVVRRDGLIIDITVEKSAGQFLDLASMRALQQTKQLPPLPAAFPLDRLTVHLDFEYQR